MKKKQIAIDGPVSSGKTTIGSSVASHLNFLFVDTGLMYRAIAWKIQKLSIDHDPKAWGKVAASIKFEWQGKPSNPTFLVDGADISKELFSPEISQLTSKISADSRVRRALVPLQREIAEKQNVVMIGRDIGTVILPEAPVKIFLTASEEVRARRRFQEFQEKKIKTTLNKVKEETVERDKRDSARFDSPLRSAPDAIFLDTTRLTPQAVVEKVISVIQERDKNF